VGDLEFGVVVVGESGEGCGGRSGFDARNGAEGFEGAVDALGEGLHVRGLAPVAADAEGEDVAGVEAGRDAAELLEAAKEEPGADEEVDGEGDLDGDKRPLQRTANGDAAIALRELLG